MLRFCACVLFITACVRSNTLVCEDGTVCPNDTVCFVSGTVTACVDPDATCDVEGGSCGTGGTCHGGLCGPTVCGNGVIDFGEKCDDLNTINGDGCSANCESDESCSNGIVDVREACDDHNNLSHDGCSSGCIVERPEWSLSAGGQPPPRTTFAMVFDTIRRRFVFFGGSNALVVDGLLGDTAEWDPNGNRWSAPPNNIAPSQRADHAMAFDPTRGVTVLFGGTNGSALGDTWEYDGTRWVQRAALTAPAARAGHAMIYDGRRRRVVLFGGSDGSSDLGDTWEWDGAMWTMRASLVSPAPRFDHAMAYDPAHGMTVLHGGTSKAGALGDTWVLDESGWRDLQLTTGPEERFRHALAFSPGLNNTQSGVILVGGIGKGGTKQHDTWLLPGANEQWHAMGDVFESSIATNEQVEQRTLAPMADHALATDPFNPQVLLMSTFAGTLPGAFRLNNLLQFQPGFVAGDVWSQAFASPDERPERSGTAMAFDPLSQLAVMFGGPEKPGGTTLGNRTFVWRGEWRNPIDVRNGPAEPDVPAVRRDANAAFDGSRIVMFGGTGATGGKLADTWFYEVGDGYRDGRWAEHTTSIRPPARADAMFTYAGGNEAWLFGGRGTQGLRDTWRWDGTAKLWSELAVTAGPSARTEAGFAYDPAQHRAILFGGLATDSGLALGDTWVLDPGTNGQGATWSLVETPLAPLPRYGVSLVWSPSRRAVILFGGRHGSDIDGIAANDTWEGTWSATGTFEWKQLPVSPPTSRSHHLMFTMADGAMYIVYGQHELAGDRSKQEFRADVWRLRYDSDTRDDLCSDIDTDGDGLVACEDPDCWPRCAPLCFPAAASCEATSGCGDGVCNPTLESCELCPDDCMACSSVLCGDFECSTGETASCPGDCP